MPNYRIVITDYEYSSLQIEREVFRQLGPVDFETAQCRTEDDVIRLAEDADAILNQYAPITSSVIHALKRCKVISRYGIGVDTIDLATATDKGIVVSNCTDYCIDEVADHALALILASARKVAVLNGLVKSGVWDYKTGIPIYRLRGKIVGLVGFGKISRNLCKKAQAMGFKVMTYDPFVAENTMRDYGVERVELDALCQTADFISIHAPLNPQTRGLIGQRQLSMMKAGAFLINTSRGPLIEETALIAALRSSAISGAALDVVEQEPLPPHHPFLTMENVMLNPHISWYSEESEQELKRKVAQNIVDVLSGRFPAYLANPEVKQTVKLDS